MARHEFRRVVRGTDGLPVEDAEVRFYEPGTTTPRPVYAAISGGSPAGQPIASDEDGVVVAYLPPGLLYKIVTTFDAITDTIENYPAVDPIPAGTFLEPYRNGLGDLVTRVMADGRAIFEADPVTDGAAQFLPGGTFTVSPTNPRHRWLKIGDTTGGGQLTQNMTVAVNKATAGWAAGDALIVVKGDTSTRQITISGLDANGLGTATLKRHRDFIMLLVQTDDGSIKFERGPQGRVNPDAADVAYTAGVGVGLAAETVGAAIDELALSSGGVIDSHTDLLLAEVTSARTLTDADLYAGADGAAAEHRTMLINLGSAGTMRVPADASAGSVWVFDIDQASAVPSVSTVGDVGTLNGFDASGGAVPLIPGTRAMVRVRSNAGSAPEVIIDGGQGDQVVYGALTAEDNGSALPHAISGFNPLVLDAAEKTASFTFDATHAGRVVPCNHASVAIVATIPTNAAVPYPVGTILAVEQVGAAAASIVPDSGVTAPSLTGRTNLAAGQHSTIGVRKRATNAWTRLGDYEDS